MKSAAIRIFAAFSVFVAFTLSAQAAQKPTNDDCLACHGDSTLSKEVNDARVWGGIHFRSADVDGHELGWRVGEAVLRDFDATSRSH